MELEVGIAALLHKRAEVHHGFGHRIYCRAYGPQIVRGRANRD